MFTGMLLGICMKLKKESMILKETMIWLVSFRWLNLLDFQSLSEQVSLFVCDIQTGYAVQLQMDACINSNKARLQHVHMYMYTPYVNTSKLANQPAQKTVSTCLVHSHLKMIFGSPNLLDIPQFFLGMLTPLLCYIHKCLKLLISLPFYFNRSIYLC